MQDGLLRLTALLILAIVIMGYGFIMHLYVLGYPESPFNRHNSTLLITLLCIVPMSYIAWKFHDAGMAMVSAVFAVLSFSVLISSIACYLYRKK